MESIAISNTEETKNGWSFSVIVGDHEFEAELDSDYWAELTKEKITPTDFVYTSFEFLLDREPVDAILTNFNLREIQTHFPEYEDEMAKIR